MKAIIKLFAAECREEGFSTAEVLMYGLAPAGVVLLGAIMEALL